MTDKVLFEQALPPDIVPVLYNRSKEAGLAILSYNGKYILSEHPENKYVSIRIFLNQNEDQGYRRFPAGFASASR